MYLSRELPYIIRVMVWKVRDGNLCSVSSARGTEVSVDRSTVNTTQVNGYLSYCWKHWEVLEVPVLDGG